MDNEIFNVGDTVYHLVRKKFAIVTEVNPELDSSNRPTIRIDNSPFEFRVCWYQDLCVKVSNDTPQQRLMIQIKYASV